VAQSGSYDLWARYLTGGEPGNFQFSIFNFQFDVKKDPGTEKFVWKKLGDIDVKVGDDVQIKNITGENAIADIVFVKEN